ncbi:MAG TPA: hypothetical protein VK517_16165 [Cyclobacteriaceae bacterium]|nr:hypothetical protein [Cyclobacteriaceae bacterium]
MKEWQIAALGYKKFQSWNIDENTVEVGVPANTSDELSKQTRTIPFKGSDILYPGTGHTITGINTSIDLSALWEISSALKR